MKKSQKETTKLILDRFEGSDAVLKWNDGEIVLPKRLLPKSITEKDELVIEISPLKVFTENREAKAKDILREIINTTN